jgi:hypothetical protein
MLSIPEIDEAREIIDELATMIIINIDITINLKWDTIVAIDSALVEEVINKRDELIDSLMNILIRKHNKTILESRAKTRINDWCSNIVNNVHDYIVSYIDTYKMK